MKLSSVTGAELKRWRKDRKWTRRYLSECLGVSESALWKWETGDCVPIVVVMACLAFEAKLDWYV